MRISDHVLRSVGFIGEVQERSESGVRGDLCATGFFVRVPSTVRGAYLYFVTARHVARDLRDRDVYVLVNKLGGGTTEILAASRLYGIYTLSTARAMSRLFRWPSSSPDADLLPIPINEFLTPESIEEFSIGIGDEVFATGFFSEIPNTTRNIPILRHGNIAMMPTEQLQTDLGFADVYLVEARSIGGISGSPVYVRPSEKIPVQTSPGGPIEAVLGLRDQIKVLGLMHGHWDVRESEMNNPTVNHDPKRGVNYGVAIVTPAVKIIETLNAPNLAGYRELHDEKLKRRGVPGMDSVKSELETRQRQKALRFQFQLKSSSLTI